MARRPGPARPAQALLSRPADGRLYALDRDRGGPPFGRPPPARRRRPLPRPPARAAPRGPLTSSDAAPLQPRAPCCGRQRFVTQLPLTFDSAGPWDRGNPCPRPNAPGTGRSSRVPDFKSEVRIIVGGAPSNVRLTGTGIGGASDTG